MTRKHGKKLEILELEEKIKNQMDELPDLFVLWF